MMNANTVVGRVAKRITGGDKYTHVGIVLNGYVYEADWPRVKKTPVSGYKSNRRRVNVDVYAPSRPFSQAEVQAMVNHAEGKLGQKYGLRSYFRPGAKANGTWCSPYVKDVLNASGRYNLSNGDGHEPQNLLGAINSDYQSAGSIGKSRPRPRNRRPILQRRQRVRSHARPNRTNHNRRRTRRSRF